MTLTPEQQRRLVIECDATVLAQWRSSGFDYAAGVVEAYRAQLEQSQRENARLRREWLEPTSTGRKFRDLKRELERAQVREKKLLDLGTTSNRAAVDCYEREGGELSTDHWLLKHYAAMQALAAQSEEGEA